MTEQERIQKMQLIRYKFMAYDLTGDASAGLSLFREWARLCGHVSAQKSIDNFTLFLNGNDADMVVDTTVVDFKTKDDMS